MAQKSLRCRLGLHDDVRVHPVGERLAGPERVVCRRCGREGEVGVPLPLLGA